jgi:predicted PurR-regulated permease PerM
VGIIILIVLLPLSLLIVSLAAEASAVYARMQSGDLNFGLYFQQILESLPSWAGDWLDRLGIANLGALREKVATALSDASRTVAVQAISIGQNTFNFFLNSFVMLYLLFFLLRDGSELYGKIRDSVPLRVEHKRALFNKFAVVVRATVKGNMVVALVQGALGGLIFWILGIQAPLLWAALMAVLALLPAIGAAVVWLPVSIYLLATGSVGRGVVLLLVGTLIISLVDNVLRPILVGKDTKMPDYVVLIATLGGLATFGIHGFVLGPLIAAMFMAVWGIFAESNHD